MTEVNRRPALPPASLWKNEVEAGTGASSNSLILGRFDCCIRRHSSIGTRTAVSTPAASHLRPVFDGGIKEFTKACLRILQLPGSHNSPHKAYCMTSQMTSQF